MKFLTINGKLQRDSAGKLITIPDNYDNQALTLNGKLLKTGAGIIGSNILKKYYNITATLSHVAAASGNAVSIGTGETVILSYTAASGYALPDMVTVTGATGVWNKDAGTLTLSNPTANVTFSITGVAAAVTKYNVTIIDGGGSSMISAVYDGTNNSGTYLGNEFGTYEISSGHIYYETGTSMISNISVSGGVSKDGTVTGDGTITIEFTCLTGDMLITLADGSQKRIDEITLDDKVLSYNPETMLLEEDTITYCDSDKVKTDSKYDVWTFSDGTIVKTVHRHRLYNVERQAMTYMDEWKIGEHAINIDGAEIELVSHEVVEQEVRHFTIFTENQNYFVNGLLSGNRHTKKMNLHSSTGCYIHKNK